MRNAIRRSNGDFYVALGCSMGLTLLVWQGRWGLLKRVLYFFGDEPSLGQKSPILHLTREIVGFLASKRIEAFNIKALNGSNS